MAVDNFGPVRVYGLELVGLFGHTYKDGKLHYQFEIEGSEGGDRYAVRLFSWLTGDPTDLVVWPKGKIVSDDVRLYATADAWHAAADAANEADEDDDS